MPTGAIFNVGFGNKLKVQSNKLTALNL